MDLSDDEDGSVPESQMSLNFSVSVDITEFSPIEVNGAFSKLAVDITTDPSGK